jgi:hypothetical protein
VAIGDNWRYSFYSTQLEGIQRLIASLGDQTHDFHIYVRIHPNLTDIDNEQTRGLAALDAPFVTVIPPDSSISTYALLRSCEKAVSFGSTIGVEATYWGVPSILLGPAFYRDLGATYNPRSHDDFMQLLARDLPPRQREPALMYGHYQATFGRPYRHYVSSDHMRGTFRGSRVRQNGVVVAQVGSDQAGRRTAASAAGGCAKSGNQRSRHFARNESKRAAKSRVPACLAT